MKRIVILGCGRQAYGAAHRLAQEGRGPFLLADQDEDAAHRLATWLRRWTDQGIGVARGTAEDTPRLLEDAAGVLSCISYPHNPPVIRAAAEAGVPYVDLGTEPDDVEALRREKTVAASPVPLVFDAGLAPGLLNETAALMTLEHPWATDIKLYCGGLPVTPVGPLAYFPYFSPESVLAEYEDEAVVLEDGEVKTVASFTDLHEVEVPGFGTLEAFTTSGGSSDGPSLHRERLRSYRYFTLRWKGHVAAMSLLRSLGLWERAPLPGSGASPREVLCELMLSSAGAPPEDVVAGMVVAEGDGRKEAKTFVVHADREAGLSAMARSTGGEAARVLMKAMEPGAPAGLQSAAEFALRCAT